MFQRTPLTKIAAVMLVAGAVWLLSGTAGGSTAGASGSTVCFVTPNPAALYSQVTITGTGFAANGVYGFTVSNSSGSVYMGFAGSDASGNISTTYNTVWTGTNTVAISGGGLSATCTFSVQTSAPTGNTCTRSNGTTVVVPWATPAGDDDCDGFSTTVENFLGTNPLQSCGTNAWPPDFNDSGNVDLTDVLLLKSHFATASSSPGYGKRFDLNTDGVINLVDVLQMKPFFETRCVP